MLASARVAVSPGKSGTRPFDPGPSVGRYAPNIARILTAVTVAAAAADLVFQRILAPVYAHVSMPAAGRHVGELLGRSGRLAVGTGAVSVVLLAAAVAYRLTRSPTRRRSGIVLGAATAAVTVAAVTGRPAWLMTGYLLVAAAAVGWLATTRRGLRRFVLTLAVAGIVLGHWPAMSGAVAELVARSSAGAGPATVVLAEIGLAAAAIIGGGVVASQGIERRALWGGALTAGIVAALLIARPEYAAMLSLWAVGTQLALPPVVYILAAGAIGMTATHWWPQRNGRPRVAGFVVLLAAGLQPSLVHHSIYALVGLMLIATPGLVVGTQESGVVS